MRVFLRVAELGSITRAAQALDTTQSAVSRQVTLAEEEFGGRLFHRTGRGVALTELGQRIAPQARRILLDLERLGLEARTLAGVPAGDVHIGIVSSVAAQAATQLLRETRAHCPEVRLHLHDGFSGHLDEGLADGRLDMALLFRYPDDAAGPAAPNVVLHSYLLGPVGDRHTAGATVRFDALHQLPLVLPKFPNGIRAALDGLARERGVQLDVRIEADSVPVQLALAASGEPVYAVASRHAAAEALAAGQLQAARIVEPGIERTLALARSARRPETLATREVARLVGKIMRQFEGEPQPDAPV